MGVNPFANHFRPTDIQGDGGRGAREEMEGGMGGRAQGGKGTRGGGRIVREYHLQTCY